jgi:hypothetical protein
MVLQKTKLFSNPGSSAQPIGQNDNHEKLYNWLFSKLYLRNRPQQRSTAHNRRHGQKTEMVSRNQVAKVV